MQNYFVPNIELNNADCSRNELVDYLYEQISQQLKSSDKPDVIMSPVRYLADRLHVAPQTLRKVYSRLESEGRIHCSPGKRQWKISDKTSSRRCLGIILPIPFNYYFQLSTPKGQRRFLMYSGIIEKATELNFSTMPIYLPSQDTSKSLIEQFVSELKEKICGLIHLGDRGDFDSDLPLQILCSRKDIAQISFNCQFQIPHIGMVSFDPQQTISIFVNYMRELGHRQFAFINYNTMGKTGFLQYMLTNSADVRRYFNQAGVSNDNLTLLTSCCQDFSELHEELDRILNLPQRPTAFFCRDDQQAMEFIQFCRSRGLEIPGDLSVVGFNNLYTAEEFNPPLTSIYNPLFELGQLLVERLIARLKPGSPSEGQYFYLPPHLVIRQSTGPAYQSRKFI